MLRLETDTAPIVLFVYGRPEHTRQTLEALSANELAGQSDLIIYSDAARNADEVKKVRAVRALLKVVAGFRSVNVIERDINYGLARNIVEGVTEVCNQYGRVIVVEDDVLAFPQFLSFMNKALVLYANESTVWHISGWNYPVDFVGHRDSFFWRVMNCWGWATWSDRWEHFQKDPERLLKTWDKEKINRFNLDGSYDFWQQVKQNHSGKINTWAIFWYATIFENSGLCLNPSRSFVRNIGFDGSGQNCGKESLFFQETLPAMVGEFPERVEESLYAVQKIAAFYAEIKQSLLYRVLHRVKSIFA